MAIAGFTYRPGVGAGGAGFDGVYVQPGTHNVLHAWGASSGGMSQETLGGWADERAGAGCAWSPDGNNFIVTCVSSDGYLWINWWNGRWNGWGHITVGASSTPMTPLLPLMSGPGPAGKDGQPGTAGKDGQPGAAGLGFTPAVAADFAAAAAALTQLSTDVTAAVTPPSGDPFVIDSTSARAYTLATVMGGLEGKPMVVEGHTGDPFTPGDIPEEVNHTPPGMGPGA